METKIWYKSRTLWFNIVTLAIGVVSVFNQQFPIDPQWMALINGVGNVFLRFLTVGPVGFSVPVGGKKKR